MDDCSDAFALAVAGRICLEACVCRMKKSLKKWHFVIRPPQSRPEVAIVRHRKVVRSGVVRPPQKSSKKWRALSLSSAHRTVKSRPKRSMTCYNRNNHSKWRGIQG